MDPQPKFSVVQQVEFAQAATQLRQGTPVIVEFPDRVMGATVSLTSGLDSLGLPISPEVYEIEVTTDGPLEQKYESAEAAIDAAVVYLREVAL